MREAMSNMEVRTINRNNIVDALLRKESLTKAGITQELGLSLVTVNTLLKELMDEGLVEQGDVLQSTGGRRPTLYQVVENAHVALGIALTPRHIRMAYVNWKLDVPKALSERYLFENTPDYWNHFQELVHRFMKENDIEEDALEGICITVPSEIVGSGSIEDIAPVEPFESIDMGKIRDMFSCPVVFADNMKAAGFSHIGLHGRRNCYVYLQIERKVGGALIFDGNYFGLSNRTGAFGEMILGDTGVEAGKLQIIPGRGRQNSFQYYCGSDALTSSGELTIEEFFEKLDAGDPDCVERWDVYIGHLAIALHNLRVIFDADIMIGGEVSSYLSGRFEVLRDLLWAGDIYGEKKEYLHFSKGQEYDSAIGAGFLILEKHDELL